MIEYSISLVIPLVLKDINMEPPLAITIANYDFDIGLQLGEKFQVSDWRISGWDVGKPFSFSSLITDIYRENIPHNKVSVWLEAEEKEVLIQISEVLRFLQPDSFR